MIFINTHNSSGLTWKSIMIINFRFHFPVVESEILWNKVRSILGQEIYLNIRTSHRSSLHDHVANAGRFQVQDQHLPKIKQIYMYYYIFQEKNVIFFCIFTWSPTTRPCGADFPGPEKERYHQLPFPSKLKSCETQVGKVLTKVTKEG